MSSRCYISFVDYLKDEPHIEEFIFDDTNIFVKGRALRCYKKRRIHTKHKIKIQNIGVWNITENS